MKTGKKDALYVVNTGGTAESEFSFECKTTPKVYCMDKKCKVNYDKHSLKCTLYLTSGYGAIVENMLE